MKARSNLVRGAGSADGDDRKGLTIDGDRTGLLESLCIDHPDERVSRVGDDDLAVGCRQARARIAPMAVLAVWLGDPALAEDFPLDHVHHMEVAVFRQDVGIGRGCRIQEKVDAPGRQRDQPLRFAAVGIDEHDFVLAVIAEEELHRLASEQGARVTLREIGGVGEHCELWPVDTAGTGD